MSRLTSDRGLPDSLPDHGHPGTRVSFRGRQAPYYSLSGSVLTVGRGRTGTRERHGEHVWNSATSVAHPAGSQAHSAGAVNLCARNRTKGGALHGASYMNLPRPARAAHPAPRSVVL